jgi:hypothetical protein
VSVRDEAAKLRGICPICEGYGGGDTPEGHENDRGCIGSCPKCWCVGCHDGQDFPPGRVYELFDGNPCGSWEAYEEIQRADRKRREVAPMPGQISLAVAA